MYTKIIIDDEKEYTGTDNIDPKVLKIKEDIRDELTSSETSYYYQRLRTISSFKKLPSEKGLLLAFKSRYKKEMRSKVPNWTAKSDYYTVKSKIWY